MQGKGKGMKLLTAFIKTLLSMFFLTFCALIAIVILTIVMPENMLQAIEVFKSLVC